MNIVRRVQVAAGIVSASAAIGAISGIIIASTMLLVRPGHISSQLLSEVFALGSQAGATFGVLLGVPVTAVLLRRVPLVRLASHTFVASTYGGIVGFALSLPFSQPRPSVGFMVVGACVGFAAAALRLYLQHRANPARDPVNDGRLAR
jgi:hypothetical protein